VASKSLGTLTLDLVAKTGGFVAGLDKAERASEKWRKKVVKNANEAGKVVGTALAAGAIAAAAGLTLMVRRSLEAIDAQSEMAKRLKTSYESLSTLARAGDMAGVSMQQIEVATRSLDINLGKASQGAIKQSEALAKLNLSADELSKLPLDERILKINQALKENVSDTERAAVAASLFGSRGAAAVQQLEPGVIAEAARQVEIFGLTLSNIDAEKVEAANDAMGAFGLLADGIGAQLTVELAPILTAIGEEFLNSAEAAGGLGKVVQEVTRDSVRALAFLIDAVDGVEVAFKFAARSIGLVGANTVEYLAKAGAIAAGFAKYTPQGAAFNLISGGKLNEAKQSLEELSALSSKIGDDFVALTEASLLEPLGGAKLLEFYDKAQEKGQAAAEAAVAGSKSQEQYSESVGNTSKKLTEFEKVQQKAAEAIISAFKSAETGYLRELGLIGKVTEADKLRFEIASGNLVGINAEQQKRLIALADELDATEALRKAQEDYSSLVKELRTDEEELNDQLNERLSILQKASGITSGQRNDTASRIAAGAFEDAPTYAGLAPEVGGAFGELAKINKAREELEDWYSDQLEMLNKYRADHAELSAQWDEQEVELRQEHQDRLAEIDSARQLASLAATEDLFGNLADISREFAGEQSDIFKALFLVQKAAAIAQSLVAIQTGIAMAAANPFPANLAAMAYVAAATASIVGNIMAVSVGQAHDGIDSIPKSGSWNLEKGERVVTGETSAKLDRTLNDVRANMKANTVATQNLRIVNAFDTQVVGDYMGSDAGEKVIMNAVRRNQRTIKSLAI